MWEDAKRIKSMQVILCEPQMQSEHITKPK